MTGNATEEYLLTKLDYPGHLDASRMAGLGGSIVGVASGLTINLGLGGVAGTIAGVSLGLGAGVLIYRWLNRRAELRDAARLAEERARHEMETERQIAEMKAGR